MTLAESNPSLRSLLYSIEDPNYNKYSHHYDGHVFPPSFDVRESDSAFFLEGDFPGVGRKEDITIEKLGPRTLIVESKVTRFNINAEWGQSASAPPGKIQSAKAEQQQPHVRSNPGMAGERNEEGTERQKISSAEQKEEKGNEGDLRVRLAERHVGYLQRSFAFPCAVEIEALKARLRCGLLVIMIPKMKEGKSDSKRINIED
jgi:HSP20 family molecular chaperone IbpA